MVAVVICIGLFILINRTEGVGGVVREGSMGRLLVLLVAMLVLAAGVVFYLASEGRFGAHEVVCHAASVLAEYLDNDENRKKWANENFARELMELFSLGEGQYRPATVWR